MDTNIKYLVDNGINIWNKDAYNYHKKNGLKVSYDNWLKLCKKHDYTGIGNLGRVYGAQWRDWTSAEEWEGKSNVSSLDQISNLIKGLKENPMGTRHLVTAWNPAELDDTALPPCHWSFEILVEPISFKKQSKFARENLDGFMHGKPKDIPEYQFTLKWHQRSVDTFLGLPFNIASYALLAQILGKMTNMIPKGIIGDLSNVHIYEPHLDAVKEQLSRDVNKHDKCEFGMYDLKYFLLKSNDSLDDKLKYLEIEDFILADYKSYPAIKAEMLAYNK